MDDLMDVFAGMSDDELFQVNDALARLHLAGLDEVRVGDLLAPAERAWERARLLERAKGCRSCPS